MMDIEKRKAELFAILAELDADIKAMNDSIARTREDLVNVHTMDDADLFDESHDLEDGLKHIRLF